jgi:ribosomal protein S27E
MYACPSCNQRTISFAHKWLSWSYMPARCLSCKSGCAIATGDSGGILVVSAIVVTLFGFAAVAVQAVYPFVIGIVLACGFYFWRQHRAKLMVVTDAEAKTANRSAWVMCLLWLLPGFFS